MIYVCKSFELKILAELLDLIFLDIAQSGYEELWSYDSSATEASIGHVCSKWRRIALRCRKLWKYFANRPNRTRCSAFEHSAAMKPPLNMGDKLARKCDN